MPEPPDPRASLANERTFLSWLRTALALIVGGVAAAKAVDFGDEVIRWVVAGPPLVGGAAMAAQARPRWARYEDAMSEGRPLPVGRGLTVFGYGIAVYAAVVLIAIAIEG